MSNAYSARDPSVRAMRIISSADSNSRQISKGKGVNREPSLTNEAREGLNK